MLSAVPAPASFMSPEYRSRLVNLEFQRAPVSLQLPLTDCGLPPHTAVRLRLTGSRPLTFLLPEAQPQEELWGGRPPVRQSLTARCGGKPQARFQRSSQLPIHD